MLIENLSFLSYHCVDKKTKFYVETEGKKESLTVQWAPRLHDIKTGRDTVHLKASRPRDTSLAVEWLNPYGNCVDREVLEAHGALFEEKVTTNSEAVEVAVHLSNSKGDSWIAKRVRMEKASSLNSITTEELAQGIGISDLEVLALLGKE